MCRTLKVPQQCTLRCLLPTEARVRADARLESFDEPPASAEAGRDPWGTHSSCEHSSSQGGSNQAQSACHEHPLKPSLPCGSVEACAARSPSAASASGHTIGCSRCQSAAGGLCRSILRGACVGWKQQGFSHPCPHHPPDRLGAPRRRRLPADFLLGVAVIGRWDAARRCVLALGCVLRRKLPESVSGKRRCISRARCLACRWHFSKVVPIHDRAHRFAGAGFILTAL